MIANVVDNNTKWENNNLDITLAPDFKLSFYGPSWGDNFVLQLQSMSKVENLIHLGQWQYWWWFWFAFPWAYYNGFFNKLLRQKNVQFLLTIVSSLRPHGKFGDFVACIIPIAWVVNILVNSNYILRLTEWQDESTLFTIRVRGRQWYWVYRYEFKHLLDLLTIPKNLGNGRWVSEGFGVTESSSLYAYTLYSRGINYVALNNFWEEHVSSQVRKDINQLPQIKATIRSNDVLNSTGQGEDDLQQVIVDEDYASKASWLDFSISSDTYLTTAIKSQNNSNDLKIITNNEPLAIANSLIYLLKDAVKVKSTLYDNETSTAINNINDSFYERNIKQNQSTIKFTRIEVMNDSSSLLKFKLKINNINSTVTKDIQTNPLPTIKQKRYQIARLFSISSKVDYLTGGKNLKHILTLNPLLNSNHLLNLEYLDYITSYNLMKKIKNSVSTLPFQITKRLLRTKKTLMLPSHTPISIITNSYDVVHSWFLPGLGIKLDCVPGKSTHNTLFIDYAGFYYGQCAEVCGRYHHHMPIRICASLFEYFLLWWNHFGLFKILKTPYSDIGAPYVNEFSW